MKPIVMVGAILVLLGLLGLAMPEFTTHENKDVVSVGSMKITANEPTEHSIPPVASGAAIIVGVVLLGGGLYRKA
jgi:hypothetical protein